MSGDWRADAACGGKDTGLFYGPSRENDADQKRREARAKAICAICTVREDCLSFAFGAYKKQGAVGGIWGGLNEDERDRENKRRLRAAQKESAA